jgi:formylglycine-generating enzyme required for sulfatase activity/lysophospholipase L1-like esterase
MAFDGASAYIEIPNQAFRALPNGSVSAWFRLSSLGRQHSLLDKTITNSTNAFQLIVDTDNRIRVAIDDNTFLRSTAAVTASAWHHVCVTWDGASEKIWFNGILDKSYATARGVPDKDIHVMIGKVENNTAFLQGAADDLRIYNRVLSASEVAELATGSGPTCTENCVTNVRAQQLSDKTVEILYDLANAPSAGATVVLAISSDNGGSYSIVPAASTLSGANAIGSGVTNGTNKKIIWNCAATLPASTYGTGYRAAVTATAGGSPAGTCGQQTFTVNGAAFEFNCIKTGTFTMGSPDSESGRDSEEGPQHQVTIAKDFWVGTTEVTQGQWQAVIGSNPASHYGVGSDYPVYNVSWNDICGGSTGSSCSSTSFIGKLNAAAGTTLFRLPTEAEWEFAARAGTIGRFSFDEPTLCDNGCGGCPAAEPFVWWCGAPNVGGSSQSVKSKQANPWGLYGMHGNVWEWVGDWYSSSYYGSSPSVDPPGPSSGSYRVVRGGSWLVYLDYCRSAIRYNLYPDSRYSGSGFRLARSVDSEPSTDGGAHPTDTGYSGTFTIDLRTGLIYAALGDSFSSGEGSWGYESGTDDGTNECHRSSHAYSAEENQLAEQGLRESISVTRRFLACSGALTENVIRGGLPPDKGPNESAQLDSRRFDPAGDAGAGTDLVTITIGGNDSGFGPFLQECVLAPNGPERHPTGIDMTWAEWLPGLIAGPVRAQIEIALDDIRSAAPNASVLIAGYPQLFPSSWLNQHCPELGGKVGFVLSSEEQDYIRSTAELLNSQIAAAAAAAGVHFVPVAGEGAFGGFEGHEICSWGLDWFNPLMLDLSGFDGSFHPNSRGQAGYAKAFVDFIRAKVDSGWPVDANGLPVNPAPARPRREQAPLLAMPTVGAAKVLAASAPPCAVPEETFVPGQSVTVSACGFAASGTATVSVRQEDTSLPMGSLISNSSGCVSGALAIPSGLGATTFTLIEVAGPGANGQSRLAMAAVSIAASFTADRDRDGIPDVCDNCPDLASSDRTDSDGDGQGNACDPCPNDPENDIDGDGLCRDVDPCPNSARNLKDAEGRCLDDSEITIAQAGSKRWIISASAHAAGQAETSWVSDVVLHNPGSTDASADLFLLESGNDNRSAAPRAVSIPAGASTKIPDVVQAAFGRNPGVGALLVASGSELVVSSRTFNDAVSGTYGQLIPGFSSAELVAGKAPATLVQLTKTSRFRTNLGFANASSSPLTVDVTFTRDDGVVLGSRAYEVAPYGHRQETEVLAQVTGAEVGDAWAVVTARDTNASYSTYASSVDNASGDPIFVSPAESGPAAIYVAAAAHAPGANDTSWRTDLEVVNRGSTSVSYRVDLLKKDVANTAPVSKSFTLASGRAVRDSDALLKLFGFTGAAALRIVPTGGSLFVQSRTYNDLGTKSYGQLIPGLPEARAIGGGQTARLVQLAYSPDGSTGFRTNIGFVNASNVQTTVSVDLYAGDGTKLGTKEVTLLPYGQHQISGIFGEFTSERLDDAFAVLHADTSGARFFAYASVVDNRSGDPVYIPAK